MKRALVIGLCSLLLAASTACASPFVMKRGGGLSLAIYPLAVRNADAAHGDTTLHTVWDFHTKGIGPRVSRASMTTGASFSLPTGGAYKTHAAGSGDNNASISLTSGTQSISGLDSVAGVYLAGAGANWTISDSYLSNIGGSYSVITNTTHAGVSAPGAMTLNLSYVAIDQLGVLHAHSNTFGTLSDAATLAVDHAIFSGAPGDGIITNGGLSLTDSALFNIATNPNSLASGTYPTCDFSLGANAHVEYVRANSGSLSMTRVLVDPTKQADGITPATIDFCKAGITALFGPTGTGSGDSVSVLADGAGNLTKLSGSDITQPIDHSILIGAFFMNNSPYTFQSKCFGGYNVTTTITNSVIQKGSVAYNINQNQGYIALTGVTGTFAVGAIVSDGSMKAKVASWNSGTGLLTIQPCALPACSTVNLTMAWPGSFTATHTLTGPAGSATIGQSILNTCQMIIGAGNFDFDSGIAITPQTL